MKPQSLFLLALLTAFFLACKKDDPENSGPTTPKTTDSIDTGSYTLLETSKNMMAYKGKSKATFVDSAGNELVFAITTFNTQEVMGNYVKHGVNEPGDTVWYFYISQHISYSLKNEAGNLYFNVNLEAEPYWSDPESGTVADILSISLRDKIEMYKYRRVFWRTIDQRTYPELSDLNTQFDTINFWNRDFSDVYKTNYTAPLNLLYYNMEFGIVAFTDHDGKLWRFHSFD